MLATIHIACTIDKNYVQHCAVMLHSLMVNNESEPLHIHIITNETKNKKFNVIKELISYHNKACSFYYIDDNILKKAYISGHVTIATYFRLLLPEILPNQLNKILFLDSDTIVKTSIRPLWEIDITNYSIAAAKQLTRIDYYQRLNIPTEYPYFNAGVLLMNLKKWRQLQLSNKLLDFVNNYSQPLPCYDQDVLNALLYNDCLRISPSWNIMHTFFKNLNPEEYGFTPEEVKEALKNVRIIHYSGSDKPWYGYTDHHYYQEYFNYLRDIPPKIRNKLSSFTFLLEAERHNKELDYKAATLSLLKSVLYYPLFIETYGKLAYTLFKWVKTKAQT